MTAQEAREILGSEIEKNKEEFFENIMKAIERNSRKGINSIGLFNCTSDIKERLEELGFKVEGSSFAKISW